jgi:enamidase
MPLGMLYTIRHLTSLGGMPPEQAIAAATGNNARAYRLNSGILAPGRDADVVLIDACAGGACADALSALVNGDIPAVAAVFTDAVPRFVGRSRNTPPSVRKVQVATNRVPFDFSGAAH